MLDCLEKAIAQVLEDPEMQRKLREQGVDVGCAGCASATALMKPDSVRWEKLIDSLRLKHQF